MLKTHIGFSVLCSHVWFFFFMMSVYTIFTGRLAQTEKYIECDGGINLYIREIICR